MIWQVLDWNSPAIDFYKKFDAGISTEQMNGKLTKNKLRRLIYLFKKIRNKDNKANQK